MAIAASFVLIAVWPAHPAEAHSDKYLGSGQWGSSIVDYYSYAVSTYTTAANNAAADWSVNTDLTVSAVPADREDIGVYAAYYGGSWEGRTVICVASGCYSSPPFGGLNEQYLYAQVQSNRTRVESWSANKKQALAAHEFGHAFSLAHVSLTDPPHIMYSSAGYVYDNWGIYNTQPHDRAAVNARY